MSEQVDSESDQRTTNNTMRHQYRVLTDEEIRILDYAGGRGLDLGGALVEKLEYNAQRADHTHAARLAAGGKQF